MKSNEAIRKNQTILILAKQVQIQPFFRVIAIAFRSKQGVYPAQAQPTMANGWSNYFKEANALPAGLPSADTTRSQRLIDAGVQGMEQLYQLEIIYWGSPSHGEQTSG